MQIGEDVVIVALGMHQKTYTFLLESAVHAMLLVPPNICVNIEKGI